MTQNGHDGMKLGSFFRQLFAHRVAEAVGSDSCLPL